MRIFFTPRLLIPFLFLVGAFCGSASVAQAEGLAYSVEQNTVLVKLNSITRTVIFNDLNSEVRLRGAIVITSKSIPHLKRRVLSRESRRDYILDRESTEFSGATAFAFKGAEMEEAAVQFLDDHKDVYTNLSLEDLNLAVVVEAEEVDAGIRYLGGGNDFLGSRYFAPALGESEAGAIGKDSQLLTSYTVRVTVENRPPEF